MQPVPVVHGRVVADEEDDELAKLKACTDPLLPRHAQYTSDRH